MAVDKFGVFVCMLLGVLSFAYGSGEYVPSRELEFRHFDNDELYALLEFYSQEFPNITKLYSIGKSVDGSDLWVIEISDNPGVHEPGEPEFKYVGNIHGNEVTGRVTLLWLMQTLCNNYSSDPSIRELVDSTRIHLLPSMNPDGYSIAQEGDVLGVVGRYNAHGVDLNRNFPDRFGRMDTVREPETQAVMDWIKQFPFVLSIGLHNGALVASYPYDNSHDGSSVYTPTPDNDIFQELALTYSMAHPVMNLGDPCIFELNDTYDYVDIYEFEDGTTNGADWYNVDGGMQDYNYLHSNCFEITVEQECQKYPEAEKLQDIWEDNKEALVSFIWEVHKGVKGFVMDKEGNGLVGAMIDVLDRNYTVTTAADGDYWRLLLPGEYEIVASANGYLPANATVQVPSEGAVTINFTLFEYLPSRELEFRHFDNDELYALLEFYSQEFPNITKLYSIGKSVNGSDLWVIEISDNPGVHEPGEPEFKYVGNIHGNEVTGRVTLLWLMQTLCNNYSSDPSIRELVDSTRIHLLPSMNPDGYSIAQEGDVLGVVGRYNAHGVDLNRNFPDRFGRMDAVREPETQAVMDWIKQFPFVLSIGFHNGALVASYPYDNSLNGSSVYTPTPDNDIFQELALTYSMAHPVMNLGDPCIFELNDTYDYVDIYEFEDGTTNGADWYNVDGGMQDYNYLHSNCFEITLEQECQKYPEAEKLQDIWEDNKEALVSFIWEVHKGVKGFVMDKEGNGLAGAMIDVLDRNYTVTTAADGDYWRLLLPGEYVIVASANGYLPAKATVQVPSEGAVTINFTLFEKYTPSRELELRHFSNDELYALLQFYSQEFPQITTLYSIGKSVNGSDLWVIEISDNPGVHEPGEPEFKYVGNIHGNEVTGRVTLLWLMQTLCNNYSSDPSIRELVDSTRIHLLPSMNPDGYSIAQEGDALGVVGRYNARGVDLNRNFPDRFDRMHDVREPETQAVMDWIKQFPFVLSIGFHNGALVASYPYDNSHDGSSVYTPTPDNDIFQELALTYSMAHPVMNLGDPCIFELNDTYDYVDIYEFEDGTTNGADWYNVDGGMQDYNYLHSNCFEITVEQECQKYPEAEKLQDIWEDNKEALVSFIWKVHKGVKGFVMDKEGNGLAGATIDVLDRNHTVTTAADGDYWRLLLPGEYEIVASANGYLPANATVQVPSEGAVTINFTLFEYLPSRELEFRHFDNDELYALLEFYSQEFPNITELYSIGKSVNGSDLWVIEISDNPGIHEPGEPEFKYVGNIHGNEVTGRVTLLWLMQTLCNNYSSDPSIRELVDSTRIHLLPSMNPDGYSIAQEGDVLGVVGRYNAHGIDLNRNFPDRFGRMDAVREPETQAVMDWIKQFPFVLSIGFHNGALVASYPYDNSLNGSSVYTPTPDNDIFQELALTYSMAHPVMNLGDPCIFELNDTYDYVDIYEFEDGTTNGADWYNVDGGMQDYNYLHSNCFEITLEQECQKYPEAEKLQDIWEDNKEALVSFIWEVHKGVKGFVMDKEGNGLAGATIDVLDRNYTVTTAADGDYWRLLLPGEYEIVASANGYLPAKATVQVPSEGVVTVNFTLFEKYTPSRELEFRHFSNDELYALLQFYSQEFPNITELYSIGKSVNGSDLWVIEISDNPGVHEPGEPEFKYVGNIHGNEVTGRVTLLWLMQTLCNNYSSDPSIRELVDSTRIHLLPSMNPDGYSIAQEGDVLGVVGRYNAHGVDLNRNFPDRFGRMDAVREPETQAVMDWIKQFPFVLSIGLHNGALVASYPYDNSHDGSSVYTPTPDNDIFQELALTYSMAHPVMNLGDPCIFELNDTYDYVDIYEFEDGTTNGADWYNVDGGMQDYNYLHSNCFEITVEQECQKYPEAEKLQDIWEDNKEALVSFIWEVHKGVKGFVTDKEGNGLAGAKIDVQERKSTIITAADGDYWRLLLPGEYEIVASANGYHPEKASVQVPSEGVVTVNFTLIQDQPPTGSSKDTASIIVASRISLVLALTVSCISRWL